MTEPNLRVVDPAVIVAWLRGRTGAHGGGFTSADDVADAIEREFVFSGGRAVNERKVPPIMEQRWWTALVLFPAWVVQEIRKARRG